MISFDLSRDVKGFRERYHLEVMNENQKRVAMAQLLSIGGGPDLLDEDYGVEIQRMGTKTSGEDGVCMFKCGLEGRYAAIVKTRRSDLVSERVSPMVCVSQGSQLNVLRVPMKSRNLVEIDLFMVEGDRGTHLIILPMSDDSIVADISDWLENGWTTFKSEGSDSLSSSTTTDGIAVIHTELGAAKVIPKASITDEYTTLALPSATYEIRVPCAWYVSAGHRHAHLIGSWFTRSIDLTEEEGPINIPEFRGNGTDSQTADDDASDFPERLSARMANDRISLQRAAAEAIIQDAISSGVHSRSNSRDM